MKSILSYRFSDVMYFGSSELWLILSGMLLLLGLSTIFILGHRKSRTDILSSLDTVAQQQHKLEGRLAQLSEDSAKRDAGFAHNLNTRLEQAAHRNAENLKNLHERLVVINQAQKNIETLTDEVSNLQNVLSNKQARGAFGEKQMESLIETYLPPNAYTFQATLSNDRRVDALIHLPKEHGDVAVDSKFPMESWREMIAAENSETEQAARKVFARQVRTHIKDIAQKYLIVGETHDIALMFLPSEAIYAELHGQFSEVIETGFSQKVMIVSPTTFMATLHTMRAVMKDVAMREQAHVIQKEVAKIAKEVYTLDERIAKLQKHFDLSIEDMRKVRITIEKIGRHAERVENVELSDNKTAHITAPTSPDTTL